jgi:hypothetical protein
VKYELVFAVSARLLALVEESADALEGIAGYLSRLAGTG